MTHRLDDFLRAAYQMAENEPGGPIKIDDRSRLDIAHDFCRMCVTVTASDRLTLELQNVPLTTATKWLIESNSGIIHDRGLVKHATIPLTIRDNPFLRDLAKSIKRTVGRGARYDSVHKNWKFICPRTAKSLESLADKLSAFRSISAKAKRNSGAGAGKAAV